jgi:glycosyltransferase involved in cell wall biosynthesis
VLVLAPRDEGSLPREKEHHLEVRRLRYFWPAGWQRLAYGAGIPVNLRRGWMARANLPGLLVALALGLARHAKLVDVIHAHWGVPGALAVAMRPLLRRPVVVTVHGSDLHEESAPPLVRRLTGWAVRRADAVIAPSPHFLERCRELRGGHDEGCHWVPHGVQAPPRHLLEAAWERRARGGKVVVATVGRLIAERRHALLIQALARLRGEASRFELVVVGDGPERPRLERLAADMGLAEFISFHGELPVDAVAAHLERADVYVSATAAETFGLATVEAAAWGLPIVTTGVGFPGELVADGQTGAVVPPDDESALAGALAPLLQRPELRVSWGRAMRQRFDAFVLDWERVGDRTLEIYAGVRR